MKITKNVYAIGNDDGSISLVKFGFAEISVSEAAEIREFVSRESFESGIYTSNPNIQAVLNDTEFDGTTDRNGNPVNFITGEPE